MGDEHLSTILETKSDEVIKSSVKDLVPILNRVVINPTPDCMLESPSSFFLSYSDNSLPEFKTFSDHTEETSSGSTITHADNSLSEYDSFLFEIEPDQGELSSVAMEVILGEPHVYVPNVLPTQPTLCPNIDTLLLFSSKNEDKVFKPGILSYLLVSHRDKATFDFFENPMMMYGGDIPLLDVTYLHFYLP
nr:hypothetical protein [Tanacetum cinerariifolium]GEZ39957.1 hypothetical protein [Tanacetum cinerariifolium]